MRYVSVFVHVLVPVHVHEAGLVNENVNVNENVYENVYENVNVYVYVRVRVRERVRERERERGHCLHVTLYTLHLTPYTSVPL